MNGKEIYCEIRGNNQPKVEHELQTDDLSLHPRCDTTCWTCHPVNATVQTCCHE